MFLPKPTNSLKEVHKMVRCASIFSQLLSQFPRGEFEELVSKYKTERNAKGFSSWSQFVSMLFCQMAQAKSLREICGGLKCCLGKLKHLGVRTAPNKSTLSYANKNRSYKLYEELFYKTLKKCKGFAPDKKFRFKNKLLSLDSSVIDLCLNLFEWAKFRRTKGAVKLHMLLDHDGYLPAFATITDGKTTDIEIGRKIKLPADSILAMDRGYNDYGFFGDLCDRGIWFVTRMKDNAKYEVIKRNEVPEKRDIISDEKILLSAEKALKDCKYFLRRVVVWDKVNSREIVLLTNHKEFGATTIAAIYKDRWEIELFFKLIKQNLKIKTFVGTSENALKIQIWTALIAILLIKFLKFRSSLGWSMSNLIAMLRWNLFTYRDLWEWINNPYDTLPIGPKPVQLELKWR